MSFLFILFALTSGIVHAEWARDLRCPQLCTCRLEHITEISINNFMMQYKLKDEPLLDDAITNVPSNDVYYDEEDNDGGFIRSATCIVQSETLPEDLINDLPIEIQALTLIQASDSGNKSIKLSYFAGFDDLVILQVQGAEKIKRDSKNNSYFLAEVDEPLPLLKYLNFERVLLKNSKKRFELLEGKINEDVPTFEYVENNELAHSLTFIQHGNDKILPYRKYVENQKNNEVPIFIGFKNLILLRIYECGLNSIHWEMFEGLNSLQYLILEKNNLRFIPDFAFYGTQNVKSLSLAFNSLFDIQIADLAGLLELEYLDLSHNNFSQLSELSLPPFPKLLVANFANNPITVIFPNTFEVLNTTNSLVLGGLEEQITLLSNSFVGLKLLESLTLLQANIPILKKELLTGMPKLKLLTMSGNIPEIEYDAFSDLGNLETLIMSKCNLNKLSIDSFIGLNKLRIIDLSNNNLAFLPPGIFDDLKTIKEIYLNGNQFTELARDIFAKIHPRLIRLNDNPWHCTCDMSEWKPILINRIKQKVLKVCDRTLTKSIDCSHDNKFEIKYVYENRIAPKCSAPKKYENWSVFHVMRKQLKCTDFKPKFKRRKNSTVSSENKKKINSLELELSSKGESSTESTSSSRNPDQSTTSIDQSTKLVVSRKTKLDKLNRKLMRDAKLRKTMRNSI